MYIASEIFYFSVNDLKVHQIKTVVSIDMYRFLTSAILVSMRVFELVFNFMFSVFFSFVNFIFYVFVFFFVYQGNNEN